MTDHPSSPGTLGRSLSRRTVLGGGVALAASTFGLASGCGQENERGPAPATGGRAVPGALGTATVPPTPARLVSVGQYRDTDAAVAVGGAVPLLSPDLSQFVTGGVTPWMKAALGGRQLPLADLDELPYERIAGLKPDLILATDRSALADEYAKLSQIAPTLSWANGYNKDPWQTTTTRIGTALGRAEQAATLVTKVESAIRAAKTANPQFAGHTFTFGPVTASGVVNTINSASDSSVEFLSQLGLVLSPTVRGLPQGSFPGRSVISPERLDLLDADVLILTFNTPQARARLEAQPVFTRIPAVARGSYIALDLPTALAIGFPTALSIPYALGRLAAPIKAALARH